MATATADTTTKRVILTVEMPLAEAVTLYHTGQVQMDQAEFAAYLEQREKYVAAQAAKAAGGGNGVLRCKVSEKGCVSVYGLNKQWPVSLYPEQWERLFLFADDVRKFSADNAAELKLRGEASKVAKAIA